MAEENTVLDDLRKQFTEKHAELKAFIDKASGELDQNGRVVTETKQAIDKHGEELKTLADRLGAVEAKGNRRGAEGEEPDSLRKFAQRFTGSPEFKAMAEGKSKSARMEIKAITNQLPPSNDAPLTPADRLAGIIKSPDRALRIRDLIPTGQTTSNLIEYAKENVFTNNAGPQVGASPTVQAENVVKPESDITFTLANAPVVTLAHFLLASRQVLADAPMLQSYIENRLSYGLKLKEEDQLLNGDGAFGNISGLRTNQTAYNRHVAGDTRIDTLRRAITQLQLSEYSAEIILLNPADWERIELQKDNENRYILANPQSLTGPLLWGRPVISTNSMPVDNFSVFNVTQAAQIWDRMQAAVELSREDDTNFRKNMVTLLAEERLALAIYRASALIGSQFPQS